MQACYAAWSELARAVGPDFINRVTGEEAVRLTDQPSIVPDGTWIASAEGRVSDIVQVFRNMHTDETEKCYEALQRILRMLYTCP
eukprot:10074748-Alexandrium_andersonii.AAC.1